MRRSTVASRHFHSLLQFFVQARRRVGVNVLLRPSSSCGDRQLIGCYVTPRDCRKRIERCYILLANVFQNESCLPRFLSLFITRGRSRVSSGRKWDRNTLYYRSRLFASESLRLNTYFNLFFDKKKRG